MSFFFHFGNGFLLNPKIKKKSKKKSFSRYDCSGGYYGKNKTFSFAPNGNRKKVRDVIYPHINI